MDTKNRSKCEKQLDKAVESTFPASDPVAVTGTTPPVADYSRRPRR